MFKDTSLTLTKALAIKNRIDMQDILEDKIIKVGKVVKVSKSEFGYNCKSQLFTSQYQLSCLSFKRALF